MEKTKFPIGIIGLGPLGMAIAELLMGQGVAVIGYRRSGMHEFVAAGGVAAESPSELVARAEVVLDCLPNEEALLSLFKGSFSIMDSVSKGQIILSLASHELSNKERLAELAGKKGGVVLDGEVFGAADMVAARDAAIFLSGNEEAIDRITPLLQLLTKHLVRLGEFGASTRLRLSGVSMR